MGSLKTDRSCKHIQNKNKNHTITLTMQFSILLVLAVLPLSLAVPSFYSAQEQADRCWTGFYRCCSSTRTIPFRCFQLNGCPMHFTNLRVYNRICQKMYQEFNEIEDEK